MGWVSVSIESRQGSPFIGVATFENPTQDWLDALVYATRNGVRFPCATPNMSEIPSIVRNFDIKTEHIDVTFLNPRLKPVDKRVVIVEFLYEP